MGSAASSDSEPIIRFYRLIPSARQPLRADRSAGGTMSTRAFRYCEPMRIASALGWYVFPPLDFSLVWDGSHIRWTFKGAPSWYNLDAAQYPNFSALFDKHCPPSVKNFAPPLLAAVADPGVVQIWSGLIARTRQDWSLLVRSPPNLPRSQSYHGFEGVIETDRWFGPLFTNVRLTKTDVPVDFKTDMPLFLVHPIRRDMYADELLNDTDFVDGLSALSEADWADYHSTIVARSGVNQIRGDYARTTRKRSKT